MKKIVVAACYSLLVFLPACNWFSSSKVPVTLRLVNVLDKVEYDDAHIKGSSTVESIQVSLEDLESKAALWDKNIPVVTYCSNYFCRASGDAARRLIELGFTDVYAYEAGIAEWYRLGLENQVYEIEGPAAKGYLKLEVKKPEKDHHDIQVISSEDLQKLIKKANMLDGGVVS